MGIGRGSHKPGASITEMKATPWQTPPTPAPPTQVLTFFTNLGDSAVSFIISMWGLLNKLLS